MVSLLPPVLRVCCPYDSAIFPPLRWFKNGVHGGAKLKTSVSWRFLFSSSCSSDYATGARPSAVVGLSRLELKRVLRLCSDAGLHVSPYMVFFPLTVRQWCTRAISLSQRISFAAGRLIQKERERKPHMHKPKCVTLPSPSPPSPSPSPSPACLNDYKCNTEGNETSTCCRTE